MKRNWKAMLVMVGGLETGMFAQQYPQQQPPYQSNPNYHGQYDNGQQYGQYDDGQYAGDSAYDNGQQGIYAPAPPPMPNYAYQRPPMPGPGYYWVDGYWNFLGGRYAWVGGYWMLPPYAGGYWVAPRYTGGRYFLGFWGGGGRNVSRGFVGSSPRFGGRVVAPRQTYRPSPQRGSGFRGDANRQNQGQRGGRH